MSKIYYVSKTECINLDYCKKVKISNAKNTIDSFRVIVVFIDGQCEDIPARSFEECRTIYNDIVNILEGNEITVTCPEDIEFYFEDKHGG